MHNLSKKSEVLKFGALKLNKRSDYMLEIMKKNFGAKNFSIMGEREMKTLSTNASFLTDSLRVFLEATITVSFF